jgi:hypothetical protein
VPPAAEYDSIAREPESLEKQVADIVIKVILLSHYILVGQNILSALPCDGKIITITVLRIIYETL